MKQSLNLSLHVVTWIQKSSVRVTEHKFTKYVLWTYLLYNLCNQYLFNYENKVYILHEFVWNLANLNLRNPPLYGDNYFFRYFPIIYDESWQSMGKRSRKIIFYLDTLSMDTFCLDSFLSISIFHHFTWHSGILAILKQTDTILFVINLFKKK